MTDVTHYKLPQTKELELSVEGSVLTIWFNRPETRNALSAQMAMEIIDVLKSVANQRSVRAIVLRGKGGVFCAGGDIKEFKSSMQASMTVDEVAVANRRFGELMSQVNEQPQLVLVLVEGAAIGGGFGLACVGDVTIVTKDAIFRLSETSIGIPPAQIAPFVTERVGLTQARRLMLTGAKFSGIDAVALGVAHFVADDVSEMEAQCAQVLNTSKNCAPGANAATKAIMFEAMRAPRDQALDFAAAGFARCMLSEEGREGITAFVEKRKPYWVSNDE